MAESTAVANGVLQTAIADEFDSMCAQSRGTKSCADDGSLVLDFGSQFVRRRQVTRAR